MNTIKLEFDISNSDPTAALGVRVTVDGAEIYNTAHLSDTYHVDHEMSDEDGEHELCIEMYGKLPEHTRVSDTGEITKDAMIQVTDVLLDAIDITPLVQTKSTYNHDFNGNREAVQDRFYGQMGCNGTVSMKFTTPVYLWLLENM